MISADVKTNVTQYEKKNCGLYISYKMYILSKPEMQCEEGVHFLFNFDWYSIQLDTVPIRKGGVNSVNLHIKFLS